MKRNQRKNRNKYLAITTPIQILGKRGLHLDCYLISFASRDMIHPYLFKLSIDGAHLIINSRRRVTCHCGLVPEEIMFDFIFKGIWDVKVCWVTDWKNKQLNWVINMGCPISPWVCNPDKKQNQGYTQLVRVGVRDNVGRWITYEDVSNRFPFCVQSIFKYMILCLIWRCANNSKLDKNLA